ncbi:MAG: iron chelate uptake ABC transporter family permease subunit [Crocinitomicaceae bacterium]
MVSSTLILVLVGLAVIASVAGVIGCYAFLRRRTLIGDAVSHSVLPGVAIGFMLSGTKDPFALLAGGLFFGYLAILSIDWIHRKSKLSEDTAIALVTTVYFALGSVLLSIVSGMENGQQAGLKNFLFGKAATLTELDVMVFIGAAILIVIAVLLFYKPFLLISFNKDFASAQGWKSNRYETLLSLLTVLVITIGLQAVGVVLMSALLIAPAAAARYWTNSLRKMMVIAALFGAAAGVGGGLLSLVGENMPTGPWVVMILFVFTLLTLLLSPNKGFFAIQQRNRHNERKINQENVMKILHQLGEVGKSHVTISEMLDKRRMDTSVLTKTLRALQKEHFIITDKQHLLSLTETGRVEAMRIVRLHRLWELYLTQRLKFKEDHIHGTAETIEHLITDDLEEALLKELDYPEMDPHEKKIPY